jgi:two-component system, NarL family, response regulator LiaR
MVNKIRLLLADDHAIVRKGLQTLLDCEPDMKVVGEAVTGFEAVNQSIALKPDVIILDMVMPEQDGVETIKQLRKEAPDVQILVLTNFCEEEMVIPAIRAGAIGYLLKDTLPEQLLQAIRAVSQGESYLHPSIALQVIREIFSPVKDESILLTFREVEVLKLVARGFSNMEIAGLLTINERTIGNHISSILSKLNLSNRTQAALYALRQGFVTLDET